MNLKIAIVFLCVGATTAYADDLLRVEELQATSITAPCGSQSQSNNQFLLIDSERLHRTIDNYVSREIDWIIDSQPGIWRRTTQGFYAYKSSANGDRLDAVHRLVGGENFCATLFVAESETVTTANGSESKIAAILRRPGWRDDGVVFKVVRPYIHRIAGETMAFCSEQFRSVHRLTNEADKRLTEYAGLPMRYRHNDYNERFFTDWNIANQTLGLDGWEIPKQKKQSGGWTVNDTDVQTGLWCVPNALGAIVVNGVSRLTDTPVNTAIKLAAKNRSPTEFIESETSTSIVAVVENRPHARSGNGKDVFGDLQITVDTSLTQSNKLILVLQRLDSKGVATILSSIVITEPTINGNFGPWQILYSAVRNEVYLHGSRSPKIHVANLTTGQISAKSVEPTFAQRFMRLDDQADALIALEPRTSSSNPTAIVIRSLATMAIEKAIPIGGGAAKFVMFDGSDGRYFAVTGFDGENTFRRSRHILVVFDRNGRVIKRQYLGINASVSDLTFVPH